MNLVLVGFMGSGKTAVGRRLAQRLGYRFFDSDHFIESELGKSITEIFAEEGEEYFRLMESKLAEKLKHLHNCVISTGGGMVTTPGNMEKLKEVGKVVFLKADLEDILTRLQRDTKRPMLKGHELRDRVTGLLEQRLPLYEQSDLIVTSGGKGVYKVAGEIIRHMGDWEDLSESQEENTGEPESTENQESPGNEPVAGEAENSEE